MTLIYYSCPSETSNIGILYSHNLCWLETTIKSDNT